MDQVIQLQQQIQRLQQEVNSISQVCNQLQQSEQANAMQLQQMAQKELLASQGLRRIQQAAGQLSQEINQISNIAQQIVSQVPFQRSVGAFTGTYGTGITGQTGGIYPQAGLSQTISQPGTGVFGGGQYGTFGLGITPQFGYNQGQNLANIGTTNWMNTLPNLLHPYSQGYIPGQFGTGSQLGYSSQAFANPLASTIQNWQQETARAQGLSGLGGTIGQQSTFGGTQLTGTSQGLAGFTGNRGVPATQLIDVLSPAMQNVNPAASQGLSLGQGNFAQPGMLSNIGTSFGQGNLGQTTTGLSSYSPYQANQFGFR